MIDFTVIALGTAQGWESVTDPLDRLPHLNISLRRIVGNQLPILLIDFPSNINVAISSWESVTDPLDRLPGEEQARKVQLGISYRSS